MKKHPKTFLGIGWKFPPTFDKQAKSVVMVSEEEDIRESLHILLSTKPGERTMQPDFGCNIKEMVFDMLNTSTINQLEDAIDTAILYFEPRITLEQIDFDMDRYTEGMLMIRLVYTIRKTNTRSNMVFPYYLLEATDL